MQANARSDGSEERGEDSESVHQNMDAPFLITHHTFTVLSSTFFSTHASTSWLVCLRNQSRSSSGMQNFFHILSAWLFPQYTVPTWTSGVIWLGKYAVALSWVAPGSPAYRTVIAPGLQDAMSSGFGALLQLPGRRQYRGKAVTVCFHHLGESQCWLPG